MFLYKNHFAFTKDLHTFPYIFKLNFEFNQKLFCYNFNIILFWEIIRIRPMSIINIDLKKKLPKRGHISFFKIEFWTKISQFSCYKIFGRVPVKRPYKLS